MITKEEKDLLNLIKYVPLFIVIIFFIIILFIVVNNRIQSNNKDIQNIQERYFQIKKDYIKSEVLALSREINYEIEEAENNLKQELKHKVNIAYKIAMSIYMQNRDKDKQTIIKLIKDAIRPIRFNNNRGYFFIYNMNLKNVLLPIAPELEGKDFSSYKDVRGDYVVKNTAKLCKINGETFYTWYWIKPDDRSKNYKKIGYCKYFKPLDWFIGTGEYVVDFEKNLQKRIIKKLEHMRYEKNTYFFVVDHNGTVLTHKNTLLTGNNYIKNRDKSSRNFVKNIISIAKSGGGFIVYKNGLDIDEKSSERISYVVSIDKWNWVIGFVEYIGSLKDIIRQQKHKLKAELRDTLARLSIVFVIVAILLLLLLNILAKESKKIFLNYKNSLLKEIEKNRKQLLIIQHQNRLAAMGEMLNNIAHQWKQPLNIMGISISKLILLEKRNMLTKDMMLKSFSRVEKNIEYLSQTIDVFRNFFKPSKNIELFDLKEEIKDITCIIQPSFEDSNIRLDFEYKEDVYIKGDRKKLKQAMMNILYNAKDAIISNNIKDGKVSIDIEKKETGTIIIVSDNGGGIPPSVIDKIFDPYFTTKEDSKGTGVGLYMSKIIIEEHFCGQLSVINDDKGAIFKIEIPNVILEPTL